MSALDVLFAQPLARGIGLGLVHSLWQGTLVALLAQAAWLVLDRRSAASRYAVGLAALLLMLVLPIVTVWGLGVPSADSRKPWARPDVVAGAGPSGPAIGLEGRVPGTDRLASATAIAPRLVPLWLLGVALFALCLLGGWAVIRRRLSTALPCPDAWRERFTELAQRMKVAPTVRLCATTSVDVPMVAGWLAPVVLVPASMMTGLAPQQLESILAHELAHVRRHDYLVNIEQSVIETGSAHAPDEDAWLGARPEWSNNCGTSIHVCGPCGGRCWKPVCVSCRARTPRSCSSTRGRACMTSWSCS